MKLIKSDHYVRTIILGTRLQSATNCENRPECPCEGNVLFIMWVYLHNQLLELVASGGIESNLPRENYLGQAGWYTPISSATGETEAGETLPDSISKNNNNSHFSR